MKNTICIFHQLETLAPCPLPHTTFALHYSWPVHCSSRITPLPPNPDQNRITIIILIIMKR